MAAIPISNGINNLLKRRNLPTLLTVYLTLTITQIVLTTNLNYLHKANNGKYKIDNLLINQTTNSDSFQFENDVSGSKNVLVYNQTGQNLDGSEQIFISIIQSPSFLICDTSLLSSILVSLYTCTPVHLYTVWCTGQSGGPPLLPLHVHIWSGGGSHSILHLPGTGPGHMLRVMLVVWV